MATIDDKNMIDKLIASDGHFADDPEVALIVEYQNYWGKTTWGVTWFGERDLGRYLTLSEYVQNPKVIWRNKKL